MAQVTARENFMKLLRNETPYYIPYYTMFNEEYKGEAPLKSMRPEFFPSTQFQDGGTDMWGIPYKGTAEATNRKLGSDMADSVTGGGLHGKDLSKADVSVNIYAFLKAQETGKPVTLCCAIGDDTVDGIPYADIVETARAYIQSIGGFEKFAEWGLV